MQKQQQQQQKKNKHEIKQQKIKDKKQQKDTHIDKTIGKSTKSPPPPLTLPQITQKITPNNTPLQFSGPSICICSSGSKRIPMYTEKVIEALSKGPVKVFARDGAISKLISLMEKLKTIDGRLRFKNHIYVSQQDSRDTLESIITNTTP